MRKAILAAVAALVAGCASNPVTIADDGSRWRWVPIGDGKDVGFGPEASEVSEALRCRAAAGAIDLVFLDTEDFARPRPLQLRVGNTAFAGREVLDRSDDATASRITIPLDHPLVSAIAAGARAIVVEGAAGRHEWPAGTVLAQMVRDCRRAAAARAG